MPNVPSGTIISDTALIHADYVFKQAITQHHQTKTLPSLNRLLSYFAHHVTIHAKQ